MDWIKGLKQAKKLITAIIGITILLFGITIIVLPGSLLVITIGLGVLATEFIWAKNLLKKIKTRILKSK